MRRQRAAGSASCGDYSREAKGAWPSGRKRQVSRGSIAIASRCVHLREEVESGPHAVQDGESWNKTIRPKAAGAWNLHALSLGLPELQHFVMFSSIVAAIGHHGEDLGPSGVLQG